MEQISGFRIINGNDGFRKLCLRLCSILQKTVRVRPKRQVQNVLINRSKIKTPKMKWND